VTEFGSLNHNTSKKVLKVLVMVVVVVIVAVAVAVVVVLVIVERSNT